MTDKFSWTRVLIRVLVAELKLKPHQKFGLNAVSGEAMGRVLAFLEECGGFDIS
jgi:hypothetical protein